MTVLKSHSQECIAMLHDGHANKSVLDPPKPLAKVQTETTTKPSGNKESEPENENEICGWGPFSPRVCQQFRNPKWILFWLCWAGGIQGMVVNGFVNVVISSVERRYDLTSTESGAISSCYDIASVLCLIPVSYFGGLGCKPRYLGIGVFIMGVGSLVFSLPQFTSGAYETAGADNSHSLCESSLNMSVLDCDISSSPKSLSNYKYVFYLGQLLHGAGAAPLYTLGTTYLDDNLPVTSSSMYMGMFYGCAILGPAVGYLAGGAFLDLYVDIDKPNLNSITMKPTNPRYVGAWWIGFLVSAALAFIVAVPLGGFPNTMPGAWKYRAERGKEVYQTKPSTEPKESKPALKILNSVRVLLCNPTFMFLNLAAACEGNLLAGFATFTPKFIQEQFSIASSAAAMFVGFAAIPAGGGGTFLGGYLVKRYSLKIKGIIRLCLGLTLPSLILALCFIVHCPNLPFTGVNIPYRNHTNRTLDVGIFQRDACHEHCHCSLQDDYSPICGRDGSVYYSPCFAGCQTAVTRDDESMEYHNCSCIPSEPPGMFQAVDGKCDSSCKLLPIFMPIFGLLMLLTFTSSMPALAATLRCVPQEERSFALGIQWIIARCLGSIPGPMLFGKLIDMSCVLWQTKCGQTGSCFFYNNQNMSDNLLAVGLVGKFFSTLFFLLALILYRGSPQEGSTDSSNSKRDSCLLSQKSQREITHTIDKHHQRDTTHSIDTLTSSINDELPNNNDILYIDTDDLSDSAIGSKLNDKEILMIT